MSSVDSDLSSQRALFDEALRGASRRLRIARLKRDAVAAFDGLLVLICFASIFGGAVIIGVRFLTWPAVTLVGWGAVTLLAVTVLSMRTLIPAVRSRPSASDVAERLDLAMSCDNRLATAEELSRSGPTTAFEEAAIADGLRQLGRAQHCLPVSPGVQLRLVRDGALALATALLILVPTLLPRVAPPPASPSNTRVALATGLPTGMSGRTTTPPEKNEPVLQNRGARNAPASASPGSKRGDNPLRSAVKSASSEADAADGRAAPAAAAASVGRGEQDKSAPSDPTVETAPPGPGTTAQAEALRPKQTAPPPDEGTEKAKRLKKNGAGGTQSKPAPGAGGNSKKPPDPSAGSSSNGGTTPPPDAPPPDGSGDGGNGPELDRPPTDSSGSSLSVTHSNDAKGDGRTSGQSQPKKSRGVAPLLLGTRQPDLFQGRPLPGPDERTKLLLPSNRDPGQLADRVDAPARSGDERPVGAYEVPAELRDVAGQYFQQFHADADVPAKPAPRP